MVMSVTEKNKAGERTECASELISILNRVTFEQNLESSTSLLKQICFQSFPQIARAATLPNDL